MKTKTKILLAGTIVAFSGLLWPGCADDTAGPLDDGSADWFSTDFGVELGDDIENARVMTQNEEAFAAKLEVIDAARAGDRLDLIYYIFDHDESSAFMASRLIEAASRGAQVRLLLDYFSNIGSYHYFKYLADRGVQVSFYNAPSETIQETFRFALTPCESDDFTSDECTADREAHMNELVSVGGVSVTRDVAFFSGVLGGNKDAVDAATGPITQQIEEIQDSGGAEMSNEEKDELMQAVDMIFRAEVQGSLTAKIGLLMFADRLDPVFNALDALGFSQVTGEENGGREMEHLTDYIHQKLTLLTPADSSRPVQFVLGGRNVQNSYHISDSPSGWESKYIFMDVDFRGDATGSGARELLEQFERQWNFRAMVHRISDEEGLAIDARLLDRFSDDFIASQVGRFEQRFSYSHGFLTANSGWSHPNYDRAVAGQMPTFYVTGSDEFTYVENVAYDDRGNRVFGSEAGWQGEEAGGKMIHALWLDQLDDACHDNRSGSHEVVIHNAYLLLPTHFQYELQEAILNRSSCPGVGHFTILTNSRESTDLNIINIFNESYIQPLLQSASSSRLTYYEYTTTDRSLHAKVMIFGDNIFIGSANADLRSQFMDSNNGIFIEGAEQLVSQYRDWLDAEVIGGGLVRQDPHSIARTGQEALIRENIDFLFSEDNAGRWVVEADQRDYLSRLVTETCNTLYDATSSDMRNDLNQVGGAFMEEFNGGDCDSSCADQIKRDLDNLDEQLMPL